MKYTNFIFTLAILSIIGCSSTYTASNFSTKQKFYEHFNKSAQDKVVKITLNNDSSFTANTGASISNDSLYYISEVKKDEVIKRSEIKDIKYVGTDMSNLSAVVFLKNGQEERTEKVNLLSDSTLYTVITTKINNVMALKNIKKVSYKNRWLGIPFSFVGGTVLGWSMGVFVSGIFNNNTQKSTHNADNIYLTIWGAGTIGGVILGLAEGYTYTYQFNP